MEREKLFVFGHLIGTAGVTIEVMSLPSRIVQVGHWANEVITFTEQSLALLQHVAGLQFINGHISCLPHVIQISLDLSRSGAL
jgi:hypothetical protein